MGQSTVDQYASTTLLFPEG